MATNAYRSQEASDRQTNREIPKATTTTAALATQRNSDTDGRCETCGAWVDPEAVRVIGTDGTVPVCGACYHGRTEQTATSTTAAVRLHRRDKRAGGDA